MSTARPNVFKRNWMRAHSLVQRTNDFANLFSARSDIEEEGREEIRKSLKKTGKEEGGEREENCFAIFDRRFKN